MLLALAVAPGLAISLLMYAMDRYDREPVGLLLKSFLLGMISVVFPLVIQAFAMRWGLTENNGTILGTAGYAFGIVGVSEELGKFLVLRYYSFRKQAFNEPFDGIIYSVMIGMGFATTENMAYVMQYGFSTGVARMFLSVPAHATFAILMGYYVGLAKFIPQKKDELLLKGWLIAVFFHGAFDFFLFLGNSIFLLAASICSLFIAGRLSIKAIRKNRELSRRLHDNNFFDQNNV